MPASPHFFLPTLSITPPPPQLNPITPAHTLLSTDGDLKPGNVLLRKDASANSKTSFIAKVSGT